MSVGIDMFCAMDNLLDVPGGDSDNDDLGVVKRYAQGCMDGDSPQRIHAVVSLLLLDLGASRARLVRVREQLKERTESNQTGMWDEWAKDLLQRALDRLSVAGVETSDGETAYYEALHLELNPPTEPFRWDRTRRLKVRWWLRRLLAARARTIDDPAPAVRLIRYLHIRLGSRDVGTMKYLVCDQCRLVLVGKIGIEPEYQGLGLGTRAVTAMFRRYPDFEWRTTAQFDTSGTFWPSMAKRTGASFMHGDGCEHMPLGKTPAG
jgi:hypothetical protein